MSAQRKSNSINQHFCVGCKKQFKSSRAINSHWQRNKECSDLCNLTNHDIQERMETSMKCDTNIEIEEDDNDDSIASDNKNDEKQSMTEHNDSTFNFSIEGNGSENSLPAKIELLKILNTAKAPLYLYDHIMAWTKKAVNVFDVDFGVENNVSREKLIQELKVKYQLQNLEPTIHTLKLRGSGNTAEVVKHSFKESLYSLLNDKQLMQPKNLLLSPDEFYNADSNNLNNNTSNKMYGDINTGTVYQKAKKEYLKETNDVLCPIIFFIDKTHTDTNGRLCLEPIRFTLGIFNRETRNDPSSWRTMGYISDQAHMKKTSPHQKAIDYHHMMEFILDEFIQCQQEKLPVELSFNNQIHEGNLKIPVLYIIGDTEGLDKICGRYTSRNNIQRPCRCCDCPFNETDNPEYKFKLNMHKKLMRQIQKGTKDSLRELSQHKLSNAWENVQFCDSERGLFGAVCGDILHCLQHGLFMYLITILFDQKKIKELQSQSEKNESTYILSKRSAFPEAYCAQFDVICRKYGKMMMHQSDRSIPRTHFYSSYTSVTRKNASEMTGILLVYLMVFNSNEGAINIDKQLGEGRTRNFIHLFELMLLLENFCTQDELKSAMVRKFHEFIPYILNTYKSTLDRQVGCQMKIIKFHLPTHFASDIQRFGSMKNFDTGIGESHHKTEAKHPAKNTQRRKTSFEYQTAKRQIENIAINMAYCNTINPNDKNPIRSDDYEECKWYRYCFDDEKKSLFQNNTKENCRWKDLKFQKQLSDICKDLVTQGSINGPFRFFTQHNRGQFIFRADPSYEKNEPWYDWASITWEQDGIIPAKLLLFWDIKINEFKKPFTIGSTTITCPGSYAISYSLSSSASAIKAHGASHLVKYAKIDFERDICIFPVESIHSPITALPYNIEEDIVSATEWIFLVSKSSWKHIFNEFMKKELTPNKTNQNKKRKQPPL
jgi:hypothetical protein